MQYALLIYGRPHAPDGPMPDQIARALDRPEVAGWVRLHADATATTLRSDGRVSLLTDGPFVDSKEYLAGLILIEAADLDEALRIAQGFQDVRDNLGAIEVRPVVGSRFRAD